jgi:predicted nuclease of predicted toxin-antitoxin system
LRLLLDEMYAPAIAAELRRRGHDVVSVHEPESGAAAGSSDADVLAAAQADGRVLVTENVRDYRPLEAALVAGGSRHCGLVYTSNRSFPRGDPATVGLLVRALDGLLSAGEDLSQRSLFLPRA